MRKSLTVLAIVLMVVVITQFFLAAGGAVEVGSSDFYDLHRQLGKLPGPLALLTALIAAAVRAPRRLVMMAVLVGVLAGLQFLIAALSREVGDGTTGSSLVFGLHAIVGLLLMASTGTLIRATRTSTQVVPDPSPAP